MSQVHHDNLQRLGDELDAHADTHGRAGSDPALCNAVADGMFLAHSTGADAFAKMCHTRVILSAKELAYQGLRPLRDDSTEVRLGTEGDVFLYVGPFRRPDKDCGFLFRCELESDNKNSAVAVPFDTGALINYLLPGQTDTQRRTFIERHEMPAPEYRGYLGKCLEVLFTEPSHYLDKTGPSIPLPYAFQPGGDERRWTFEVRVAETVSLPQHLEAVFVPIGLVGGDLQDPNAGSVREFLAWCKTKGISIEYYSSAKASHAEDFAMLQRKCVTYIRDKFGA